MVSRSPGEQFVIDFSEIVKSIIQDSDDQDVEEEINTQIEQLLSALRTLTQPPQQLCLDQEESLQGRTGLLWPWTSCPR